MKKEDLPYAQEEMKKRMKREKSEKRRQKISSHDILKPTLDKVNSRSKVIPHVPINKF